MGCFTNNFTCKFLVSYKKAIYIGPVKDKDTYVSKRILKAEQYEKYEKAGTILKKFKTYYYKTADDLLLELINI